MYFVLFFIFFRVTSEFKTKKEIFDDVVHICTWLVGWWVGWSTTILIWIIGHRSYTQIFFLRSGNAFEIIYVLEFEKIFNLNNQPGINCFLFGLFFFFFTLHTVACKTSTQIHVYEEFPPKLRNWNISFYDRAINQVVMYIFRVYVYIVRVTVLYTCKIYRNFLFVVLLLSFLLHWCKVSGAKKVCSATYYKGEQTRK